MFCRKCEQTLQVLGPANDVSQEHRILDDYEQEENLTACIYGWAEVVSELYDSGREGHTKKIVSRVHTENVKLNRIRKTLKSDSACLRLVRETSIEVFKKRQILKTPCVY